MIGMSGNSRASTHVHTGPRQMPPPCAHLTNLANLKIAEEKREKIEVFGRQAILICSGGADKHVSGTPPFRHRPHVGVLIALDFGKVFCSHVPSVL